MKRYMTFVATLTAFLLPWMVSGCGSSNDYRLLDAAKAAQYGPCNTDPDNCPANFFCASNMRVCLPDHCKNETKDAGETGHNCGGTCRPAYLCPNGPGNCTVDSDCASNFTGACQSGTCVGRPNGAVCNDGNQCQSNVCENGVCGGTAQNNCGGSCPSGQVCDTVTNTCRAQSQPCGGSCPSGQVCNVPTNTCFTPSGCNVTCGAGTQCSPVTNTCVPNGSANAVCTTTSDCSAGLNCVASTCVAPLAISGNMNPSDFTCYPFAGRTDPAPAPTACNNQTVFNGTSFVTQNMFCCPNNGVYGSLARSNTAVPTGCQGIGERNSNTIVSCHPLIGNTAAWGVQR